MELTIAKIIAAAAGVGLFSLVVPLAWKFVLRHTAAGAGTVSRVLDTVARALRVAMADVGQRYLAEIERASADGVLTQEEVQEARRRAVNAALSYLGPRGVRLLLKYYGGEQEVRDALSVGASGAIEERRLRDSTEVVLVEEAQPSQ